MPPEQPSSVTRQWELIVEMFPFLHGLSSSTVIGPRHGEMTDTVAMSVENKSRLNSDHVSSQRVKDKSGNRGEKEWD